MRYAGFAAFVLIVFVAAISPLAQRGPTAPQWPGYKGDGVTLLPNGWRIAPEGRHVTVGDLPLNFAASPDGRFLAISTSGFSKPALSIFDTRSLQIVSRIELEHTWLGLAWHPDGKRLYASGSSENVIYEFTFQNGRLAAAGNISLGSPERHPGRDVIDNAGFVGGIEVDAEGKLLYVTQIYGQRVRAIDLEQRKIVATADLDAEPYTCMLSEDGETLFVSLWGGAKVLMLDPWSLIVKGEVAVGDHPNAMALTRDGTRLFVACANTNAVWVVDLSTRTAKEQISVALGVDAPAGSTPNAVAVSPDGRTLLVANADNNTITVADVSNSRASVVKGWIPVGWYPTAVMFDRDGSRMFVLNGKGLGSAPNPRGTAPGGLVRESAQYIGSLLLGSISVIHLPADAALTRMTARVRELTPYSDARRLAPADSPGASPIPRRVGDSSPIKHVFYVIRENRTYDQVLGDLPKGNGDPNLTLFGQEVTPNAHALVTAFVTFDNFYVDAEVSYDGHAFSTGAYATDFVEKMWPANYARREGLYLSEGGYKMRNPFGNITAPARGYLWDSAKRADVTYRSYGEFTTRSGGTVVATVPGLDGHINTEYPPYDLSTPDNRRIDAFEQEFKQLDERGTVPRLTILRLGNDHTNGASPGTSSPRAFVAENDLALGRLVEIVSHSRVWKESAIFVLEDDAQNGPDHVDAHRSVLLAVSPFTRRGAVDSTLYTTSGVLRTMELILALPPMSQYDAAATPMYNAFTTTPDVAPFTRLPARVPLDEKNDWSTPGAAASLRMNFVEPDLAPDLELNQIIWEVVRGKGSVMPPPRRTGFIRAVVADDDDR